MKAWLPSLACGWFALLATSTLALAQSPTPGAFPVADAPAVSGTMPGADQAPDAAPVDTGTTRAAQELPKYPTANALWDKLQDLEKGPPQSATQDDVHLLVTRLAVYSQAFVDQYPKDPRRWDAKLVALRYSSMLMAADNQQPDPDQIEGILQSVANAPDASHEARVSARISLIGMHSGETDQNTLTPELNKEMLAFIHDFPDDPNDAELQKARYGSLQKADADAADKMLDSLLKDKNPAVADMARGAARMRDLKKKPLDLTFTAADGTKVDLAKLRGKVVIIDFWATWCAPCMQAVPEIVNAYKNLHGKGLEIVGISLDEDKGAMEGVTQSNGMVWPQYFDGKGWENAISTRYGITDIPQMWLVDRKGMVVDTDGADGLADKVAKLVAQ
jgi:thiol-disulfide isomerase/thioredoxin